MRRERFVEIHDTKYFKSDIENMTVEQVHMVCGFIETEPDLRWVQFHCIEEAKFIIDNILIKL